MQEMIDIIRAAIASDATTDQKAAAVTACRTIITALDTEPGKPLVIPGVAPIPAMPRVSIDQVFNLIIARLSMIANERERETQQALPAPTAPAATPPASRGLRIPTVAPPPGIIRQNATRATTTKTRAATTEKT